MAKIIVIALLERITKLCFRGVEQKHSHSGYLNIGPRPSLVLRARASDGKGVCCTITTRILILRTCQIRNAIEYKARRYIVTVDVGGKRNFVGNACLTKLTMQAKILVICKQ